MAAGSPQESCTVAMVPAPFLQAMLGLQETMLGEAPLPNSIGALSSPCPALNQAQVQQGQLSFCGLLMSSAVFCSPWPPLAHP